MLLGILLVVSVESTSHWDLSPDKWGSPKYLLPKPCPPLKEDKLVDVDYKIEADEAAETANLMARHFHEYSKEVHFYLYTRINPLLQQELWTGDSASVFESRFDFTKKTLVIVHGWTCNGTSYPVNIIKDAYLGQNLQLNIISVDWNYYAEKIYLISRLVVPSIGRLLADLLRFLISLGIHSYDLHMIGHGLGAHIVGIAAKQLNFEGNRVHAITGLDPALPLFAINDTDNRLDKEDADFVQVIHTNGGSYGMMMNIGHIDFYPNGGKTQPGCGGGSIVYGLHCSHRRAVEYFVESFTAHVPFFAVKCKNWNEFFLTGICKPLPELRYEVLKVDLFHFNLKDEGVYFFPTESEPPFSIGDPRRWHPTIKGAVMK